MFSENELHGDLRESARSAANRILGGSLKEDDEQELFRPEYMHALGEEGLCGIPTSEQFDGFGMGYVEYAIVLEEIAKVSSSYAVSVAVTGLPQVILSTYGNATTKGTVDTVFGQRGNHWRFCFV